MRIVIDTNCLVVSIPEFSKSRWIYDGILNGKFEICLTTEILEEYEEVLSRFYSPKVANNIVEMLPLLENSVWVIPHFKWNLIDADPDDNKFVDCTLSSQADFLVTHDNHFNILKTVKFPKINVVNIFELKEILKK